MKKQIDILLTGGTFDKNYNPHNGKLFFTSSHIDIILNEQNFLQVQPTVKRLMLKDSLDMTDSDRSKIVSACLISKAKSIVVIHGTDTMVKTGRVIEDLLPAEDSKTVILTGAMRPFSLKITDAPANLAAAMILSQILPSGVYITMSGTVFPICNVLKDLRDGCFKPQNEEEWKRWIMDLNKQPNQKLKIA